MVTTAVIIRRSTEAEPSSQWQCNDGDALNWKTLNTILE